jgi:hypothetical protein
MVDFSITHSHFENNNLPYLFTFYSKSKFQNL